MSRNVIVVFFVSLIAYLTGCEDGLQLLENVPVGNANLAITGFPDKGVLREDTLTIYGHGFNPISYQNTVLFPTVSVQEPWVDPEGNVTDSLVYRVTQYSLPAVVADSSPDSLKVLIPSDAVFGQVIITFGVDTARSPQPYNLISTELRPRIVSYVPQFGGPGVRLNMTVSNMIQDVEKMIVGFGELNVIPDEVYFSSLFVKIPELPGGPVDLRVGKKIEGGDTLWSAPVNLGVLPGLLDIPEIVVSYNGDFSNSSFTGVIGYGEVVQGETSQIELNVSGNDAVSRGVAYNLVTGKVYWLDVSAPALVLGNIPSATGNSKVLNLNQPYNDLVRVIQGGQEYFYLGGNQIRRIKVNENFVIPAGDPLGSRKVWPAGTPSSTTTNITNLEIVGSNVFWIDDIARTVNKGVLSADGLSFTTVETIYDASSGIQVPFGLAVDQIGGSIYLTQFETVTGGNVSRLLKGSLDGSLELEVLQEYKQTGDYAFDVEIDTEESYLYWANGRADSEGGIYRVPLANATTKPQLVYQFPNPRYFEINTQ
jgi:hypothetical protein